MLVWILQGQYKQMHEAQVPDEVIIKWLKVLRWLLLMGTDWYGVNTNALYTQ